MRGSSGSRRARRRWLVLTAVLGLVSTGCLTVPSGASGGSGVSGASSKLISVFVQKFRYHGMPTTISAGVHSILFQNRESFAITHEMIPVALPAGKTAKDLRAEAKAKGPDSEDEWLHIGGDFGPADTGASVVETLFLPPGTYAIACWQTGTPTGKQNGPTHASLGMVFQFTVTS